MLIESPRRFVAIPRAGDPPRLCCKRSTSTRIRGGDTIGARNFERVEQHSCGVRLVARPRVRGAQPQPRTVQRGYQARRGRMLTRRVRSTQQGQLATEEQLREYTGSGTGGARQCGLATGRPLAVRSQAAQHTPQPDAGLDVIVRLSSARGTTWRAPAGAARVGHIELRTRWQPRFPRSLPGPSGAANISSSRRCRRHVRIRG